MAISKVQIVNMALSHLGKRSTIEDLGEESPEARLALLWYDQSLKQSLNIHDWIFARRRQALAVHSEEAPHPWLYRYEYPADCVRFRLIENPMGPDADAIPFKILQSSNKAEKTILTDVGEAYGWYTFWQTDTTQYSMVFVDLLSLVLASRMWTLTAKTSIKRRLLQEVRDMIEMAPALDANEQVARAPRQPEQLRARE